MESVQGSLPASKGRESDADAGARASSGSEGRVRRIGPSDVPERPTLADGIELSGRMEDSAYEEQPWLILRGGAFVQVSELLYRLAELCTGEHDHGAIAERLGAAIDRDVTADNVRTLLGKQLIPLGIVPLADGSVVPTKQGADERSPLQINARMRMIGPRVIDPPATLFQALFFPLVLLPLLGLGLAVVGWAFFVHGLGKGMHNAMYEPWLVLVLLPIVVASAFFHEFGHAAALKYGGGKVRGMGAGLYIVYPVFYTDVTDNYRLGRWAKVRTDTGGFYFNLVFALAIMGLYLLTGQEFLLLAILVIVFSIVHQALPFVRLDGYWTMADLTGVPDPLGQIGPFLRSILPFWRGRELPEMKAWVKVVLVLYLVITIPLLLVLTIFMLASAPRILATAWDSLGQQLAALGERWSAADALGVAAAVVGIAVLALTALGIVYFIVRLVRAVIGRIWGWAGDSGGRRVVAGIATLLIAGFIVYLWLPPLPATGNRAGPLYANLRPLASDESFTWGDAWRDSSESAVTGQPPRSAGDPGTTPDPEATPAAEPTPEPRETPRATPRETPRPTPTAQPGGGGGGAATPRPTATPTPTPTPTPAP